MSGVLPPCLVSLSAVLIMTGTGTNGPTSTASPCSRAGRSASRSSLKDSDAACIVFWSVLLTTRSMARLLQLLRISGSMRRGLWLMTVRKTPNLAPSAAIRASMSLLNLPPPSSGGAANLCASSTKRKRDAFPLH